MYVYIYIYICVYIYIYIYTYNTIIHMGPPAQRGAYGRALCTTSSGRNENANRTGRTEPSRAVEFDLEPAGTGCGTEPNRNGPSHDASERRRPNRVEPG